MKWILLKLIKLYQTTLSFDHGFMGKLYPNTRFCRFHPTCSEYGYAAIEKYGVLKGSWMAAIRIIRCGPWTPVGTYDPVR